MSEGKKRFTLDLDPSVHMRLKVAAVNKGISIRQFCLSAIGSELSTLAPPSEPDTSPCSLLHFDITNNRLIDGRTSPKSA